MAFFGQLSPNLSSVYIFEEFESFAGEPSLPYKEKEVQVDFRKQNCHFVLAWIVGELLLSGFRKIFRKSCGSEALASIRSQQIPVWVCSLLAFLALV